MRGDDWFTGCFLYDERDDLARTTLVLPASPGVVLFSDAEDRPILLLTAADVRRLVRRRLGENPPDEPSRRTRLTPVVRRVWWRSTWSAFETQWSWFELARQVYPETWDELLNHPRAWMLALPREGRFPTFDVTSRPLDAPARYWGPFPTRQGANAALQIVQDLFDLCRCPGRLHEGECVADCPYAQMGRCGAALDNRISSEAHRRVLDRAVAFLDQPLADALAEIDARMHECARQLDFEQAQQCKRQLDRARALSGPAYRWAGPLRDFAIFSLQPGPSESIGRRREPTLTPFLIHAHGLDRLEPVQVDQIYSAASALFEQWRIRRDRMAADHTAETFDPAALAWAVQMLHRRPDERSVYLAARDCPDPGALVSRTIELLAARTGRPRGKMALDSFHLSGQNDSETGENGEPGAPSQEDS